MVYLGSKEEREELRQKLQSFDSVLLTSFDMVLKDEVFFNKFKWQVLIVDEAHRLKNYKCEKHYFELILSSYAV